MGLADTLMDSEVAASSVVDPDVLTLEMGTWSAGLQIGERLDTAARRSSISSVRGHSALQHGWSSMLITAD